MEKLIPYTKWIDIIKEDFVYHKKLSDILWNEDDTIKERIREKFVRIAKDFYEGLNLDADIIDIILTGSMCAFNYSASSDFDVHIIIDFSEINDDYDLVKELVSGKKFIWNTKHNITIQNHEVELYIQDKDEPHTASGLYSLLNDEWIKKPKYNKPEVDEEYVNMKYEELLFEINAMKNEIDKKHTPEEYEYFYDTTNALIKKIILSRREGLAEGGEFSIENLVFKKVRSEGNFTTLFDLANKFYDKIFIQ